VSFGLEEHAVASTATPSRARILIPRLRPKRPAKSSK